MYTLREIFLRCRARAFTPAAPPCSRGFADATSGPAVRKTGNPPPASFATPSSSASGQMEENSRPPTRSLMRWPRDGRSRRRPAVASDSSSAPEVSRCCNWTARRWMHCTRGVYRRRRNQRHTTTTARHRLDYGQPEDRRTTRAHAGQRDQARLPAGGRRSGAVRADGLHPLLPAADGLRRSRADDRPGRAVLPRAPALEALCADPQGARHPVGDSWPVRVPPAPWNR